MTIFDQILTGIVILCTLIQTFITFQWFYRGYILKFKNFKQNSDRGPLITSFTSDIINKTQESSHIEISRISKTSKNGNIIAFSQDNINESIETPQYIHTMNTNTYASYSLSYPWDNNHITKLYTIISLVTECLWCWIYGFYIFILPSINEDLVDSFYADRTSYLFILIIISRMCVHLYCLERLRKAFQNSIWVLSRYQYKLTRGLLIITSVCCGLFFMISDVLNKEFNIESINPFIKWIIIAINNAFWGSILLYMFLRRLLLLKHQIISTKTFENTLKKFYRIIACFTILAIIIFTSTLATLLTFRFFERLGKTLAFIDIIINAVCLVFTYGQYMRGYNICCCICRICFEI